MLIIYIISTKGFIYVMILDNFFVYRAIDFQERFMSTILTGKDAPLEQTLEHFTDVARRLNLDIIEDNWLNPTDNMVCKYQRGQLPSNLCQWQRCLP